MYTISKMLKLFNLKKRKTKTLS